MAVYTPFGAETIISGTWTAVNPVYPAGELYKSVAKIYPSDTSYISSNNVGAALIVFPFDWDAYFSAAPSDAWINPVISSITFTCRSRALVGTSSANFTLLRGVSASTIGTTFSVPLNTFTTFTQTITTDPIAMGPWTPQNVASSLFGYTKSGNRQNDLSWYTLSITMTDMVGGSKAPLSPRLGEPAYFCAVCSKPLHLSSLIYVTDDEHPQYSLLVCPADYDEDPEDRDEESERLREGDIDFGEPTE